MKVISQEISHLTRDDEPVGLDTVYSYKFDTGHSANVYNHHFGATFVYTKNGNYASQKTMHKVKKVILEYLDNK
jgi:hypothetical protein